MLFYLGVMDKNKLLRAVNVVLEALYETPAHEAPRGHVYLGLQYGGYTYDDYGLVEAMMERAGLVTKDRSHVLRLTEKGVKLAVDCLAARAAGKGASS